MSNLNKSYSISYRSIMYALLLCLLSCTHALHQYQVSDGDRVKGAKKISAESSQFVILGFVQNTDYVNKAWNDLQRQCLNGKINGINSRYNTDHGFFSWTNVVKMSAYCIK